MTKSPLLRWTIRVAVAALCAGVAITPILGTPFGGDDLVNHNTWPNMGGYPSALAFAFQASGEWIQSQGRFFPGTFVLMATVWDLLDSRPAYKAFLVASALAVLVLFAVLLWRVVRDLDVALLGTMALVPAFQLRYWLDPWAQFHGLVALTLVLILVSFLLADRFVERGGKWWLVGSLSAMVAAGLTYETSLLSVPSIALLIALRDIKFHRVRIAIGGLVGVAAALGLLALILRIGKIPSPPYQLGWGPRSPGVIRDQFLGALPFSQYWMDQVPSLTPWLATIPAALVLFGIPLAVVLFPRAPQLAPSCGSRRPWRKPLIVMAAGFLLAFLPALMLGLTKKFQLGDFQGAYISVGYQSVGIALALTGVFWGILRTPRVGRRVVPRAALALAVAAIVALTIAANAQFVASQVPGDVFPKPSTECRGLPYAC